MFRNTWRVSITARNRELQKTENTERQGREKTETLFFVPYMLVFLQSFLVKQKLQGILKTNYNIDMRIVCTTFQV